MGKYRDHRPPKDHGPEGDHSANDSEPRYFQSRIPEQAPRSYQPPPTASSSSARVDAEVLWFNTEKGFGFVRLADNSEAFLHQSKLQAGGHGSVSEGSRLTVTVETSPRGQQVREVLAVGATGDRQPPARMPAPLDQRLASESQEQKSTGTVKRYDATKGYGFISLESGGRDVFVHATALARSDLTSLEEGQKVVVSYIQGKKGPEAKALRRA